MLVFVVAVVAAGCWMDSSLHRIPALADYPERPATGKGTTWLLVGSDSRQGLTPEQQAELATGDDIGNGRTDTILLVHVPAIGSSTPTTMVSIPRDSYVPIPGYGEDKINAAFTFGGAPLLAQTVEQATGIRLDHYAEIGFDGFAVMVDAVGGVTMCPHRTDQRPARRHRPARGLPEARRPQRARLRPHPRHPACRPGSDDQPAAVHVGAAAPRRQPGRAAQSAALVSDGACGDRRAHRRFRAPTSGIWRGWRGRCAAT